MSRRRVGLQMTGRGIAREGCPVYDGGRQVGVVTSGTHCPWVGQAVALALVDAAYKEPGTPLQVDVRAAGWTPRWSKRPSTGGIRVNRPRRAAAPSQLIL